MDEKTIEYRPIGTVHSPFETPADVPKHATDVNESSGTVELCPEYAEGLTHIDSFSHIVLVTHLHLVEEATLRCDPPFVDDISPGIFATRGPARPNPIGLTVVRLTDVDGTTLTVENVDLVDGTPVLDIKPFAPKAEELTDLSGGWLEEHTDQDCSTIDRR